MSLHFPTIIVVLPLLASFLTFFCGWWAKRASYLIALTALGGCFLIAIGILNAVLSQGVIHYRIGGWPPPWGIAYRIDHLSAYMIMLITSLSLFTAVYAPRTVAAEMPDRQALFWCLYLLLNTGILGITLTADLFNLFVLLEVSSLSGYALVAVGRGRAKLAGFRYLLIGTIGATFYLIGTGYLYILTGSLNMEDLQVLLPPLYGTRVVRAAFLFMLFGFGIKIALFPLHAWQPDAYTYAPSAVSVIISTAVAKTSTYALIRVVYSVFTLDFVNRVMPLFDVLCWAAAVAMVFGSVFAIVQNNLKKMLAYSSVSNVGYIVLGVSLAPSTVLGLTPALMHLLNHAVIKGAMYMAACAFIHKFNLWDIRRFEGLGRRMPLTCLSFLLASLAMIGMPPSAGFVTKWYLILAILDARKYALIGVIFLSTLLMIIYFWRVVEMMYIRVGPQEKASKGMQTDEIPVSMLTPCLSLGLLTFGVGIVWMTGSMDMILEAVNQAFGLVEP